MTNEILVPAEREIPHDRLVERRELLVQAIAADLARNGRFAALRSWLAGLGFLVALVAVVGSIAVAGHGRVSATQAAVEAAALGTAPVVLLARSHVSPGRLTG